MPKKSQERKKEEWFQHRSQEPICNSDSEESADEPNEPDHQADNFYDEEMEAVNRKVALLKLESKRTAEENRHRAKEVFGLLMRAGFRREKNGKFQPCKDDLKLLKEMDPPLCRSLRDGTLLGFCQVLHPLDSVHEIGPSDQIIVSSLERKDSLFHLHGNQLQDDFEEFKDLSKRANILAKEIRGRWEEDGRIVQVDILDGHGRMVICLIKAVMDLELNPDQVMHLRVFETDEEVHSYHQYVLPRCIEKINETVLNYMKVANNSVVYLNFCSIPSSGIAAAWNRHFQNQTIENWVPHCCKENVLKFIWQVTHPPQCCTVMVSLVIRANKGSERKYCLPFPDTLFTNQCKYITGFGFLFLLRKKDLFNATLVSERPEDGIKWKMNGNKQPKREPVSLKSGSWGHPFVTLLVQKDRNDSLEQTRKLQEMLTQGQIADLKEHTMQIGARVQVTEGTHKGKIGKITKRTVATLGVECRDKNISIHINECVPKD